VSGVTNFTLRGLTLSGGRDPVGGAIYISPGANVMLTNCTLAGNGAVGNSGTAGKDAGNGSTGGNGGNGTGGSQATGGAIYNLGSLTIWNSSFLTNNATGGSGGSGGKGGNGSIQGGNGGNGGAGALGYGGAIYNLGTLVLTNCTLSGNTASGGNAGSGGAAGIGPWAGDAGRGAAGASGNGAAIYSVQSLTAVNCTFSGNAAQSGNSTAGGTDTGSGNGLNGPRGPDSLGGGVYHQGSGTFNNCTFANNTVTAGNGGNGGDLYPIGIHTPGKGGDGGNGIGGGIFNTGTVAVLNCTFASCGATGGTNGVGGGVSLRGKDGDPGHGRGGDIAQGSGAFLLQNSILGASSSGTNAYETTPSHITDVGFNISSDSSLNLSGTSLKNTDPQLGSLASNGGPTQTIAIQSNSPALNRIPASLSPPTDQRGVSRPQGPASDVGAFELATLPAILAQPQSQTNAAGSAVTFAVSAVGDPLGYQWRFNTNAITNATGNSYTIGSVASSNGGSYDVVITNGFGSVTSSPAILTVIFPPVITLQPTNLTVTAGSNAAFAAQASSVVSLAYQWKFNGTNIQATAGTSAAGLAALGLTITNAQAADAGSYTVVVSNVYGAVASSAATLTVNALPTNTSLTVSGRIVQGGVGLSGVTVLAGTNSTVTGADGYYTNLNLSLGTNVLVAPSLGGYAFAPAAQSVVVLSNTTLPDFSAFPSLAVVPSGSGVFQLAFAPGFTCQIQASSNMVNWQTFYATNNLSTNTLLLRFTDTNYATLPARFYRLGQTLVGQPVLTNCFASNQIMSVCGVAAPIVACRIEASTNLKSWTTVFTTNLPAPAAFQFEHAEVVAPPVRFYRLSQTPGF
jgi:hypothetical protein